MRERAPDIRGDETVDLGRRRREAADRAMPVEEDRGDPDRAQMIAEIEIGGRTSASFAACVSSFEVSSSSFADCSSSFIERSSSFEDFSSSFAASRSCTVRSRSSRARSSSCSRCSMTRSASGLALELIGARRGGSGAESLENQHVEALLKAELWHGLNGQPYPLRALRRCAWRSRAPPSAGCARPRQRSSAGRRRGLVAPCA